MAAQSPARRDADTEHEVHYTAFIRLPFPRGDFVDPPLVDWDAAKDRALWKILSRNPRSADLDWKELASRFEVTLPFILQQAAWLYERQLSQVRAQMRKVSKDGAPSSSQGGQPMQRLGSTEKGRQSGPGTNTPTLGTPRIGSNAPREHPMAKQTPPMSRNTSTNTITQSRPFQQPSPGKQPSKLAPTPLQQSPKPAAAVSPPNKKVKASDQSSSASSDSSDESSESPSDHATTTRSQMFRRPPPRFMSSRAAAKARVMINNSDGADEEEDDAVDETNDEDDDEDTPAFLPLAPASDEQQQQDLGATLRHPQHGETAMVDSRGVTKIPSQANTESSVSSASSAVPVGSPREAALTQRPPGLLSPQHRAEMGARLSPRGRGTGREGSDGAPSMGSSFSDLDDASVTQSALEEALISNLQHGGASRMSNVSQAFRSRNLQ